MSCSLIGEVQGARTESGEVGELRRVVGHGAHEPVRRCLPHRVEQATEYVEPEAADIAALVDVDLVVDVSLDRSTGVMPTS